MDQINKPKILVISQNFPPELTASSVLVNNIFSYYKGEMEAIGGFVFGRYESDFKAPCKTYYLIPPNNYYFKRIYYKFTPIFRFINKFLMKRLVRKIKPDVIFGNYPEIEFFIDSYEISKELNIPFYAYFHDLWEENMHKDFGKKLAIKWEKEIVLGSRRVICCTENQREHYFKKYGVFSDILLHPVPDNDLINLGFKQSNVNKGEIAFVGSLSAPMNLDALKKISHALASMEPHYKLVWFPIQDIPVSKLISLGFDTSRIEIRVVKTAEMRKSLTHSEFLLAPLSFENCSELEVQTVFSNKLLTYFISQRPILVFGPDNSYHSSSAVKNGWGFVIDDDKIEFIKEKVKYLSEDISLQNSLIEGALKEAKRRKSSSVANELMKFINEDTQS